MADRGRRLAEAGQPRRQQRGGRWPRRLLQQAGLRADRQVRAGPLRHGGARGRRSRARQRRALLVPGAELRRSRAEALHRDLGRLHLTVPRQAGDVPVPGRRDRRAGRAHPGSLPARRRRRGQDRARRPLRQVHRAGAGDRAGAWQARHRLAGDGRGLPASRCPAPAPGCSAGSAVGGWRRARRGRSSRSDGRSPRRRPASSRRRWSRRPCGSRGASARPRARWTQGSRPAPGPIAWGHGAAPGRGPRPAAPAWCRRAPAAPARWRWWPRSCGGSARCRRRPAGGPRPPRRTRRPAPAGSRRGRASRTAAARRGPAGPTRGRGRRGSRAGSPPTGTADARPSPRPGPWQPWPDAITPPGQPAPSAPPTGGRRLVPGAVETEGRPCGRCGKVLARTGSRAGERHDRRPGAGDSASVRISQGDPPMARGEHARVAAVESGEHADRLHRLRHSSAHIMAQAVRERFQREGGKVSLGVGPATADGFYYDFLLPRTLSDDDLGWIERRMREIIAGGYPFVMHELPSDEAKRRFADEPFKLELIDGIEAGNVDDNGEPLPPDEATALTVYQHDDFVDLCRGPHVERTSDVDPRALKLLGVAGAYWRGDEHRPMLQRIYGTAWETPEDLEQFLWRREEAERRDHRRLGRELELFHLDPTAPGMPYWLPKGLKVLNALLDFWRRDHEERGYQEISSPLVNDKSLWETSGHWDHYKDNMFIIPVDEHTTYALKPMNCPNAHVVYNLKVRSYRDLPLRLSDCDILHRYERSGTLHGLLRVRRMQQDDAHIFVTPDQIGDEYARIFDICDQYYSIFGLRYELRLGTRPDDHIGDVETWDRAESTLKSILDDRVGSGRYTIEEGDGAFYGPKIDILMYDALGREWQMGTIQLDMQLPGRFGCTYTDSDGQKKTPVVIHRVIYGSLERFLGILIEHTAGAFPLWISPVQVKAIPVRLEQSAYAEEVAASLRSGGLRVEVDHEDTALAAKIRRAQLEKVPIMLVLGQREVDQKLVSPRLRTGENLGAMPLEKLSELLRHTVDSKAFGLQDLVRAAAATS